MIFAITTDLHRDRIDKESEIIVDTTVQEKNITFPTDTKLHSRIIGRCWRLADKYEIKLRRRYRKELRQCLLSQRWRRHPGKAKLARKAQKRIKTIAGILLRELDRKLPSQILKAHLEDFKLYLRVLNQQKTRIRSTLCMNRRPTASPRARKTRSMSMAVKHQLP